MVCYHPLSAWQSVRPNPLTGKSIITFQDPLSKSYQHIDLPCGHCIGCRLSQSRAWAIRCVHEASLYDHNCFITLTYDNDHLPTTNINKNTGEVVDDYTPTLVKRDMQLFMKRLRKAYSDSRIRFFGCGEYGSKNNRPHYHIILFNFVFPDLILHGSRNGFLYFRSPSLEKLWTYGFSLITSVSYDSCAYVARYVTKKLNGEPAKEAYAFKDPEFTLQSRRPGIGADWLSSHVDDVYNYDRIVMKNFQTKPPRYYDKLFDIIDHDRYNSVKDKRIEKYLNLSLCEIEKEFSRLPFMEKFTIYQTKNIPRIYEETNF